LFANQILKEDGSGLSAFFYSGHIDLPKTATAPFEPDSSFGDAFYRLDGYGSWMFTPKVGVQGAYQLGRDHFFDPVVGNADDTFQSQGFFGEVDFPLYEHATFGGRYDFFDPSTDREDNEKTAVTIFANLPMNDGLQGLAEFQHIQTKRAAIEDLKDDNVQLRVVWIW
jgi:hypothetical protein